MLALLLTAWLGPCAAQGNELVMATTFSPSATVWIIDRWQKEPGSVMIRTLNRTSASLEQLLDTANAENVDLILTSSPMLLQHLQEHQKLAPFSGAPAASQHLVPESIRSTSVAVAISGFGLLMNRSALMTRHLPAPTDWDDLTDPRYQGALLMSSPSRSDTNHLIIAVWLYGEPGTGRMTGARYLHQLGRHAEGPFIACELNPANAHTLNELIAKAQGGTLVLSHLEHLTHEQQHQLVQLQSHEKRPFRLIGIGSASLVELAASSQIVAELYYCFALTQIGCQSLSKRPDDIEPLFHHYLQKTCQRLNHPVPEVDAALLKGMMRRVWPNNVRELANAAELFAVGVLPLAETVNPLMHIGEPTPLDQRVEDVERQIITEALNIHQGRINEVAEYLLIPRKKLYLRMKKYGLNKEHYKGV